MGGVNFLTNSTGLGLYFASEVAKMHKHRECGGGISRCNPDILGRHRHIGHDLIDGHDKARDRRNAKRSSTTHSEEVMS